MREIKFGAEYNNRIYEVETRLPKRKTSKGIYTTQGYVKRLVTEHPFADKRGYVGEHRLVVEASLGRFLLPTEFIHHIDQNRGNNEITNLKLLGASDHAMEHLKGIRNPNGRFIASEPIFADIKFRLHDKDRNITAIYTLQELIATTYRRGKFEFRGRFTGLKDRNGKEIYEFMELDNKWEVDWLDGRYILRDMSNGDIISLNYENEYTITREYTKIQKNYEGSAN